MTGGVYINYDIRHIPHTKVGFVLPAVGTYIYTYICIICNMYVYNRHTANDGVNSNITYKYYTQ